MNREEITTANLDALVLGHDCTAYQRALAKNELERLKKAASLLSNTKEAKEEQAIQLLRIAKCPNTNCDGKGTIAVQTYPNGEWEPEPCQWCYEKDELLTPSKD